MSDFKINQTVKDMLKNKFKKHQEEEQEAITLLENAGNPNSNFTSQEEFDQFHEAVKMGALRGTARHSEWLEWNRKKQEEHHQEQQQAYQEFEQQRQQRLNASRLSVIALADLEGKE